MARTAVHDMTHRASVFLCGNAVMVVVMVPFAPFTIRVTSSTPLHSHQLYCHLLTGLSTARAVVRLQGHTFVGVSVTHTRMLRCIWILWCSVVASAFW